MTTNSTTLKATELGKDHSSPRCKIPSAMAVTTVAGKLLSFAMTIAANGVRSPETSVSRSPEPVPPPSSIPSIAPIPDSRAAIDQTSVDNSFTLMPSSSARSAFSAEPRTAVPTVLRRKNSANPTKTSTVTTMVSSFGNPNRIGNTSNPTPSYGVG